MIKIKELGQVPTPDWIVCEILDAAQYQGESILRCYALEPSCGDGAFLSEIVQRYIVAAKAEKQSNQQIADELGEFVVGVEIDEAAYSACINRLNDLVQQELGGIAVKWRIYRQDTLDFYRQYPHYFDWILGNPPYVRLHRLDDILRARLRQEFRFTVGTTDLYLAFFEMAFFMLSKQGRLGFITPNSFLRNTSYQKFRQFLQEQRHLVALYDLKSHKVFEGFSTYTAISIFDFSQKQKNFVYKELVVKNFVEINRIGFTALDSKKWTLSNRENSRFLDELQHRNQARLQDFFHVQYGFATLRDKIFIGKPIQQNNGLSVFNGMAIESAALRPIVKGSRYQGAADDVEAVLFPYFCQNGRYVAYQEDALKQKFPLAYAYLLHHREELLKRDCDKNAQWFEFGRSQGLQTSHQEKIVVSTLVNGCVRFFRLPENVLVYSGIFITRKSPDVDWQIAENALSSPEFFQYARLTGKDMSGGYKSLSSKQIKAFVVSVPAAQPSLF